MAQEQATNSRDNDGAQEKGAFTPSDVNRVGVRIPPFWAEKPAVWFAQVEGNFILSGIKDEDTKYYYVMSQLDQRYAAEVEDLIVNPPDRDKYLKLKTELIKRLSISREKEVKQLLIHEELGDRRPSQFLRHMQQLAGPNIPEDFLKSIWTSRLPVHLQTVVVSRKNTPLEELAELADQVHDIVPISPQVATTTVASASSSSTIDRMANEIAELTRQVKALSSQQHRRSRSPQRNTNKKRGNSKTRSESNYRRFPICFFHYKYGEKAFQCLKPCDFQGNASGSR